MKQDATAYELKILEEPDENWILGFSSYANILKSLKESIDFQPTPKSLDDFNAFHRFMNYLLAPKIPDSISKFLKVGDQRTLGMHGSMNSSPWGQWSYATNSALSNCIHYIRRKQTRDRSVSLRLRAHLILLICCFAMSACPNNNPALARSIPPPSHPKNVSL